MINMGIVIIITNTEMCKDYLWKNTRWKIERKASEKSKTKCEEADTTIYELVKAVIYELANGEIKIAKRQELTHQHEDKGE